MILIRNKEVFAKDPKNKLKAYQFIYERLNNFLWYDEPFAKKYHRHVFSPIKATKKTQLLQLSNYSFDKKRKLNTNSQSFDTFLC